MGASSSGPKGGLRPLVLLTTLVESSGRRLKKGGSNVTGSTVPLRKHTMKLGGGGALGI